MPSDHDDSDQESGLGEAYPLLEQDAEPPGRWVDGAANGLAGAQTWEGQMSWRTRHGEALVLWSLGKPRHVKNALYPDGTRGQISHTLDHGYRRRGSGERLWTYGEIKLSPDDVVFVDGQQPALKEPLSSDQPNLEADLASDPAFLESLQDDRFAEAVYEVFKNRTFCKGDHQEPWFCGDRQAARLVAQLRNRGESYQDYYLGEFPGTWPDDRVQSEALILRTIEQESKPIEFSIDISPPFTLVEDGKSITIATDKQFQRYLERSRRDFEARRPRMEAARIARLQQAKENLKQLQRDENAEIYASLRRHLTRLNWRTETQADQEKAARIALTKRMVLLRELKQLEERPPAAPANWTKNLSKRMIGRIVFDQTDKLEESTEEEREAATTAQLQERLTQLALDGKVSQEEFGSLRARIANPSAGHPIE